MTAVATDGAHYPLIDDLDGDNWPDLVLVNCDNGISSVLASFVYWGGRDGYSSMRRSEIQTFNPGRAAAADLTATAIRNY